MDADGNSPCISLDSGSTPLQIDLRDQRWDRRVGDATWDQVRVFDTDLTSGRNFTSFKVTVRDGATGEVLIDAEVIGTDGVVDLSGIDPVLHPSLAIRGTARSVDGGAAWADGQSPKVQLRWNADEAPLHVGSLAAAECPTEGGTTVAVAATSGESTDTAAVPVATPQACIPSSTSTTSTTTPGSTDPSTSAPSPAVPVSSAPAPASPEPQAGGVAPVAEHQAPDETAPQSGAELPRTGSSLPSQAPLAVWCLLAGAAMILLARWRARRLTG